MSDAAETIGAKIEGGVLPSDRPDKLVAGFGQGQPCSVCERRILPVQVEWSIIEDDVVTYRFHIGCHSLWDVELEKRRAVALLARSPLEIVTVELGRYPGGVCLTCLAHTTSLALATVTATIAKLEETVAVSGLQGTCAQCGDERRLVRL